MGNQMVFKRYELKYLISHAQRAELNSVLKAHMAADSFGHSSIRNLYYDTPDFRLIRTSLERPVYKEKLRIRSYGRAAMADDVFVELKKKYDSVVYKRRITLPQQEAIACLKTNSGFPPGQISREIHSAVQLYANLRPQVFLCYERDAFYPIDGSDFRITFDENIRWRTNELTLDSEAFGTALLNPGVVLMELKVSESIPLWMVKTLSRLNIYKTTFSKYGTAYMQMMSEHTKGVIRYA